MSMKFNGTELSDVYFNGTQLDKVYFNGVLVFEKVKGYFRRIMTGDKILSGAELMSDFPLGYYNNITTTEDIIFFDYSVPDKNTYDKSSTFKTLSNSSYKAVYSPSHVTLYGDVGFYEYNITTGEEHTLTDVDNPVYDLKITDVVENEAYRHIYVKDENIRPIQVGDDLSGATLYFTFPDNFLDTITEDCTNNHAFKIDNDDAYDSTHLHVNISLKDDGSVYNEMDFRVKTETSDAFSIPIHERSDNFAYFPDSVWNLSKLQLPSNYGVCTQITNTSNKTLKKVVDHVFVDKNTLGTHYYKRRIQVGDELSGKYIYNQIPGTSGVFKNNIPTTTQETIKTQLAKIYTTNKTYSSGSHVYKISYADTMGTTSNTNDLFYYYVGSDGTVSSDTYNGLTYVENDYTRSPEVVTSIVNGPIHRSLYIEDPYIRPIQKGDILKEGTKFYFVFPDDMLYKFQEDFTFFMEQPFTTEEGTYMFLVFDIEVGGEAGCYWYTGGSNATSATTNILKYTNASPSGTLQTNLSTYTCGANDIGTVNYVAAQLEDYVLVDTRTLGNPRPLRVGDILKKSTTNILCNFTTEFFKEQFDFIRSCEDPMDAWSEISLTFATFEDSGGTRYDGVVRYSPESDDYVIQIEEFGDTGIPLRIVIYNRVRSTTGYPTEVVGIKTLTKQLTVTAIYNEEFVTEHLQVDPSTL